VRLFDTWSALHGQLHHTPARVLCILHELLLASVLSLLHCSIRVGIRTVFCCPAVALLRVACCTQELPRAFHASLFVKRLIANRLIGRLLCHRALSPCLALCCRRVCVVACTGVWPAPSRTGKALLLVVLCCVPAVCVGSSRPSGTGLHACICGCKHSAHTHAHTQIVWDQSLLYLCIFSKFPTIGLPTGRFQVCMCVVRTGVVQWATGGACCASLISLCCVWRV
jgi:hypothetical protein